MQHTDNIAHDMVSLVTARIEKTRKWLDRGNGQKDVHEIARFEEILEGLENNVQLRMSIVGRQKNGKSAIAQALCGPEALFTIVGNSATRVKMGFLCTYSKNINETNYRVRVKFVSPDELKRHVHDAISVVYGKPFGEGDDGQADDRAAVLREQIDVKREYLKFIFGTDGVSYLHEMLKVKGNSADGQEDMATATARPSNDEELLEQQIWDLLEKTQAYKTCTQHPAERNFSEMDEVRDFLEELVVTQKSGHGSQQQCWPAVEEVEIQGPCRAEEMARVLLTDFPGNDSNVEVLEARASLGKAEKFTILVMNSTRDDSDMKDLRHFLHSYLPDSQLIGKAKLFVAINYSNTWKADELLASYKKDGELLPYLQKVAQAKEDLKKAESACQTDLPDGPTSRQRRAKVACEKRLEKATKECDSMLLGLARKNLEERVYREAIEIAEEVAKKTGLPEELFKAAAKEIQVFFPSPCDAQGFQKDLQKVDIMPLSLQPQDNNRDAKQMLIKAKLNNTDIPKMRKAIAECRKDVELRGSLETFLALVEALGESYLELLAGPHDEKDHGCDDVTQEMLEFFQDTERVASIKAMLITACQAFLGDLRRAVGLGTNNAITFTGNQEAQRVAIDHELAINGPFTSALMGMTLNELKLLDSMDATNKAYKFDALVSGMCKRLGTEFNTCWVVGFLMQLILKLDTCDFRLNQSEQQPQEQQPQEPMLQQEPSPQPQFGSVPGGAAAPTDIKPKKSEKINEGESVRAAFMKAVQLALEDYIDKYGNIGATLQENAGQKVRIVFRKVLKSMNLRKGAEDAAMDAHRQAFSNSLGSAVRAAVADAKKTHGRRRKAEFVAAIRGQLHKRMQGFENRFSESLQDKAQEILGWLGEALIGSGTGQQPAQRTTAAPQWMNLVDELCSRLPEDVYSIIRAERLLIQEQSGKQFKLAANHLFALANDLERIYKNCIKNSMPPREQQLLDNQDNGGAGGSSSGAAGGGSAGGGSAGADGGAGGINGGAGGSSSGAADGSSGGTGCQVNNTHFSSEGNKNRDKGAGADSATDINSVGSGEGRPAAARRRPHTPAGAHPPDPRMMKLLQAEARRIIEAMNIVSLAQRALKPHAQKQEMAASKQQQPRTPVQQLPSSQAASPLPAQEQEQKLQDVEMGPAGGPQETPTATVNSSGQQQQEVAPANGTAAAPVVGIPEPRYPKRFRGSAVQEVSQPSSSLGGVVDPCRPVAQKVAQGRQNTSGMASALVAAEAVQPSTALDVAIGSKRLRPFTDFQAEAKRQRSSANSSGANAVAPTAAVPAAEVPAAAVPMAEAPSRSAEVPAADVRSNSDGSGAGGNGDGSSGSDGSSGGGSSGTNNIGSTERRGP